MTESVGYLVKQVQSLLRLRMEASLAPLGLTVSHYSCLFRLQQQPGISAAQLARAVFMTRQSMNEMLQTLLERGLVDRPTVAASGRALPVSLTASGAAALAEAQTAVDAVEERMLARLGRADAAALAAGLTSCAAALEF